MSQIDFLLSPTPAVAVCIVNVDIYYGANN